jgi:uncharacterized protein YaiE (UPF0345 family)
MSQYRAYFTPNMVDPSGTNPVVVYYAIRIGIAAAVAVATVSWAQPATELSDSWGVTDLGELPNASFSAWATGKGDDKKDCPVRNNEYHELYNQEYSNYWPVNNYRSLRIGLQVDYSHGDLTARFNISSSGANQSVGYQVLGAVLQATRKKYKCECFEFMPCVSGSITVRETVDQPWPMSNVDEARTISFGPICADGTPGSLFSAD